MKFHRVSVLCVLAFPVVAIAQNSSNSSDDTATTAQTKATKSSDQADTSGVEAAILKLKKKEAELKASTPDDKTLKEYETQQYYKTLDAQSKTDGELFIEKVKEKAGPDDPTSLMETMTDVQEMEQTGEIPATGWLAIAKAFRDASTSSNTAGPGKDMIPLPAEQQKLLQAQMEQYYRVQRELENARRNLDNQFISQPLYPVPPSPSLSGPQISASPSNKNSPPAPAPKCDQPGRKSKC